MRNKIPAFFFSLALILGVVLVLASLVPVYDLLQGLSGVEETSGYNKNFLHKANTAIRDYLYGYRDNLLIESDGKSLFGGQEIFHMAEVRLLFTRLARAGLLFFALALLSSYLLKTRLLYHQLFTSLGLLVFMALAGAFFEKAFILMHRVFFNNDLWLFPPDSQLIVLLPESFFYYFTLLIIFVFIGMSVIFYLIERIYHDFTSGPR
ncbi:MAG TPA: DUF1461 domain-containing protein [Clostridia bacterium]|nr:DUF1461 domain-containing protein [Clostridia bacterium]